MKKRHYKSYSDFIAALAPQDITSHRIFRGQKDSSWLLQNRWKRFRDRFVHSSKDSVAVRQALIQDVIRRFSATGYTDPNSLTPTDIECMAQHTGLPTRLMDWTQSPYIALFFALDGAEIEDCGAPTAAVFELNLTKFTYACCYSIEKDPKVAQSEKAKDYAFSHDVSVQRPCIIQNSSFGNRRMLRQEGVFLLLPDSVDSLEDFEKRCIAEGSSEFLMKHEIDVKDRLKALSHIRSMGNSAASIYCDPTRASIDAALAIRAAL
jgi:hypothetical protein